MRKITTYKQMGRSFEIVRNDGRYLAIEDKYITDGRLNTKLNGLQMCAADTLKECLRRVSDKVELEAKYSKFLASGMSEAQALAAAIGVPVEIVETV